MQCVLRHKHKPLNGTQTSLVQHVQHGGRNGKIAVNEKDESNKSWCGLHESITPIHETS